MKDSLICPNCGSEMVTELYGRIEIDGCTCGQLWFDHTELSDYVEQWSGEALAPAQAVGGHIGSCPRCGEAELLEFEVSGQRLHRCARCRGVSLERRRLERLLADPDSGVADDGIVGLRAIVFGRN